MAGGVLTTVLVTGGTPVLEEAVLVVIPVVVAPVVMLQAARELQVGNPVLQEPVAVRVEVPAAEGTGDLEVLEVVLVY